MIQAGYTPPAELSRVRSSALIAGVVLSVLLIIGAFMDRAQFFHAYLVGFIFSFALPEPALKPEDES